VSLLVRYAWLRRLGAVVITASGLCALTIPTEPAQARVWVNFEVGVPVAYGYYPYYGYYGYRPYRYYHRAYYPGWWYWHHRPYYGAYYGGWRWHHHWCWYHPYRCHGYW
jgi:hypothetical protein